MLAYFKYSNIKIIYFYFFINIFHFKTYTIPHLNNKCLIKFIFIVTFYTIPRLNSEFLINFELHTDC